MTRGLMLAAGLCIALLASALGFSQIALSNERAAHAQSISDHNLAVAASKSAALFQSEQYRKKEQELRDAENANATLVQARSDDLVRADRAATAAAGRLQIAVVAAAARARESCATAGTSGVRASADDPIGVLIDVLARADARAGVLADIADRRGLAGQACERSYDSLYKSLTE